MMDVNTLMWFKVFLFLFLATPSWAGLPPTRILDEGVDKGVAFKFDCVGAGIACTQSGVTGTLTVGTGSGGDSISIDGVAVTDPNFTSTGDVYFVDTTNVVTGMVVSVRPAAENSIEVIIDLQDLQGAVTDAQVPNTITVDLATTATTANAGDSATSFFASGTLEVAIGGTGTTTSTGTGAVVLGTSPTFTTSVILPQGAAPSLTTAGNIAVDTTSDQLKYYGGAERVLSYFNEICVSLETPVEADDNIPFFHPKQAITITDVTCEVDGGTSISLTISDGTNVLEAITCDGDGAADDGSIANGAFIADERMEFDLASPSGTNTWLNFCVTYTYTAD